MRLIIVEKEISVTQYLGQGLKRKGYCVDIATDGLQALEMVDINEYDLMLLAADLPDRNGLEVCRSVRKRRPEMFIIILSPQKKIDDIVSGLDAGADDYLVQPFHIKEVSARIRALFRRDINSRAPILRVQDIRLDPAKQIVWKANKKLKLTSKEFQLLEYFMHHPGVVISQEDLLEHVWGSSVDPMTNTIRVHIQSLRRKLEENGSRPCIETIVGAGYRLQDSDLSANQTSENFQGK